MNLAGIGKRPGLSARKPQISPADKLFLQTMMGMAIQTGEPQMCSDCLRGQYISPLWLKGKSRPAWFRSVVSQRTYRFWSEGNRSVVNVSYPLPEQMNEWQKRLIPVFCRFLGQIITSNRLLNDLEKEVNSRTSQLDGSS